MRAGLGGLARPSRWKVWIAGREISELPDRELANVRLSRIGFTFQSYNVPGVKMIGLRISLSGRWSDGLYWTVRLEQLGDVDYQVETAHAALEVSRESFVVVEFGALEC